MKFYTNIFLSLSPETIKHIIGKKGRNFKYIANHIHSLDCIWFNNSTNAITLYGDVDSLMQVKEEVCSMITQYTLQYSPNEINNIYNKNPPEIVCKSFIIPEVYSNQDVNNLIGIKGFFFKELTRKASVDYIWFDRNAGDIKVYGQQKNIDTCFVLMKNKLELCSDTNEQSIKKRRIE